MRYDTQLRRKVRICVGGGWQELPELPARTSFDGCKANLPVVS